MRDKVIEFVKQLTPKTPPIDVLKFAAEVHEVDPVLAATVPTLATRCGVSLTKIAQLCRDRRTDPQFAPFLDNAKDKLLSDGGKAKAAEFIVAYYTVALEIAGEIGMETDLQDRLERAQRMTEEAGKRQES